MKFTHGVWFDREHTQIWNAVEVAEVSEPTSGALRALCTVRHLAHRGDTLNHPTITLQLESPAPGIIGGKAWHFRGAKVDEPRFELFPDSNGGGSTAGASESAKATIRHDDDAKKTSLETGGLRAVVNRNPKAFHIGFESSDGKNPRQLTDLGFASVQYVVAPPSVGVPPTLEGSTTISDAYYRATPSPRKRPYMSLSFGLQPNEYVYGLGERFGPFVKNGQEIDLWNEDAGTCTPYSESMVSSALGQSSSDD
jgi:alpha-D-xyloside xylohydrolase